MLAIWRCWVMLVCWSGWYASGSAVSGEHPFSTSKGNVNSVQSFRNSRLFPSDSPRNNHGLIIMVSKFVPILLWAAAATFGFPSCHDSQWRVSSFRTYSHLVSSGFRASGPIEVKVPERAMKMIRRREIGRETKNQNGEQSNRLSPTQVNERS